MTSLTVEQITYRVRKIIADHNGSLAEDVGLGDTMDDCGFDSLDHVQITMAVEEELRVQIPDEDIFGDTTTVAQIIDYATKRLGAA